MTDDGYTISVPTRTQNPDTVAALIERLNRLESHRSKWAAEGEALEQSIVEAKQAIKRAMSVLAEALGGTIPEDVE